MMLFKPEHIPLILEGKKTQTRRRWQKSRAKVGSVHQARTTLFGKPFAHLAIIDVYQERLKDMPPEDAIKEGYPTLLAFQNKWLEINKAWFPSELVYVVSFALVSINSKDKGGKNS